MTRKFYSAILCAFALLFVGCSSHPPSAAQFMNVKKEEGKFNNSFNAGVFLLRGDAYRGTSHIDEDYGDMEDFGNLDLSLLFRYSHFIAGGSFENMSFRCIMGFRSQYIGLQGWGSVEATSVHSHGRNTIPLFGGLMLIEEYPISDAFRVGVSEHFSRNVYKVDSHEEGIGFYSSSHYAEFGFGAYAVLGNFSFEFRYGREIGEPRNRFYFMTHYAFFN